MAMEHAGIKADDMAHTLGVHRGTVTRWTHDVGAQPRRIYLERWSELTGVDLAWLLGEYGARRAADNRQDASRDTHEDADSMAA